MMNEEGLREILAIAFTHLRDHKRDLFQLRSQIASMRDLLKASPEFARKFSERVEEWQLQNSAVHERTLAVFDEIIRRLTDG